MTYAHATGATQQGAIAEAKSWSRWPQTIAHTLIHWQARAEQRRRLGTMDDRMLADMGVTRAEADQESQKPFWQA